MSLARPGGNVTGTSTLFSCSEADAGAAVPRVATSPFSRRDDVADPYFWAKFEEAKRTGIKATAGSQYGRHRSSFREKRGASALVS
jgi:hypothetical protein